MEQRNIKVAVLILLLIVVGMFIFAYLKKQELQESPTPPVTNQTEEQGNDPYAYITRIDAKHFFIDGTHTLVGEIQMPTPCDLLNWDTRVAESMPEMATVAFSVINRSETCAQVVTMQRFKISFEASESAAISALFNERKVELNLIPALPGETPESYELFIKG